MLTLRVPEELAHWLAETSRLTGVPVSQLVREHLEKLKSQQQEPAFMRHAGSVKGTRELSSRKGFSG